MVKEIRLAIDEADAEESASSWAPGVPSPPATSSPEKTAVLQPTHRALKLATTSRVGPAPTNRSVHPFLLGPHRFRQGLLFWGRILVQHGPTSPSSPPEVRHISNTSFMLAALSNWKQAHRWALTGDHMGAEEALRIGVVTQVVPEADLDAVTWALAERIALVPEASVRVNKAVTWMGMEAMGLGAAMQVNAALSSVAHSSHGGHREALWDAVHRRPHPGGP